ncbi:MAG: UDP-3-O-(3-hydroxymyristoyl)glucosamine N-acyltransferase [Candidatus Eremiobacteraeota bacterium]|nr:UDP-3-O-(3-hydroxymyristoyl)glucosamine N-acyltransferase [Candidatus Eremiobacteraeota bacterium]
MNESGLGSLAQVAQRIAGRVVGDPNILIKGIAAVQDAGAGSLTFAAEARYLQNALDSKASAILTDEELAGTLSAPKKALVLVRSTRAALAALLSSLAPALPQGPFLHASAIVDSSAVIGTEVYVGPLVFIGANARIAARCVLEAGAHVAMGCSIGEACHLFPRATVLDRCELGNGVILHSGAVIGSDGFGYVFIDGAFTKIPQVGNVVLEDDVEIGANTCIDRAQMGSTVIGRGSKIDNLVQIGHNCRIGRHSAFAAQAGLAGTTIVGDYVQAGGQSGFKGHITIGSRAKIGGGSAVWSDIPDDAFVSGRPAREHREELRREVMVRKLPKLIARVDALEGNARHASPPTPPREEGPSAF